MHQKMCMYNHTHNSWIDTHTHTETVLSRVLTITLDQPGDYTQLSAHTHTDIKVGHGQIHHKLTNSRLVHKGPLPPGGPEQMV